MLVPVVSTSLNSRTTIKHGPTCEAAAPSVGVAGGQVQVVYVVQQGIVVALGGLN